jgi:hypothetical protein
LVVDDAVGLMGRVEKWVGSVWVEESEEEEEVRERREMSRKLYKIGFGSLNKVVVRKDESEEEEEHCGCVVEGDESDETIYLF